MPADSDLSEPDLSQAPKFCSPLDRGASLEERARVYLDVNCAMCHQPNGPGNANIDLRYTTDLESTNTINVKPAQDDLGIAGARLISPGHPERSLMWHRMNTKTVGRMPSIGSNRVDPAGTELLRAWIESLRR